MAITHTITIGVARGGGDSVSRNVSSSGGKEINLDETIANGATDLEIAFGFPLAKLQSFYLTCDQAITINVNDAAGGTPDATWILDAGKAFAWYSGSGIAASVLFVADVTALFITNESGSNAELQIRALIDPT